MNTLAITLLLLIRIVIPLGTLLSIGEWTKRHEANYWSQK